MPQDTEKCPLSVLTVVRIKRVNFRNCPLYTGVGIKRLGCSVLQKLKFMSVFFLLKEISTNPARCSVGNKILLLYTFVTVKKKKKKNLTEWSCARRLPWNVGTKVEFQNPLSEDAHELRKYELFQFDFFIACNFRQFLCLLLHGSVCVKGSHRANNGKQRTRIPGDLSFIKTSSCKGHIRLKLVIIMIRLKSTK